MGNILSYRDGTVWYFIDVHTGDLLVTMRWSAGKRCSPTLVRIEWTLKHNCRSTCGIINALVHEQDNVSYPDHKYHLRTAWIAQIRQILWPNLLGSQFNGAIVVGGETTFWKRPHSQDSNNLLPIPWCQEPRDPFRGPSSLAWEWPVSGRWFWCSGWCTYKEARGRSQTNHLHTRWIAAYKKLRRDT